jgi:hypothetical protein
LSIWLALWTRATELLWLTAGFSCSQAAAIAVSEERSQVIFSVALFEEGLGGGPTDTDAGAGDYCSVHFQVSVVGLTSQQE